jgi:hypothetical protein
MFASGLISVLVGIIFLRGMGVVGKAKTLKPDVDGPENLKENRDIINT